MESIKKLFNNASLKNKLFSMILLNVTILLFCSLLGNYLCTKMYNELLFKTIAGNLSISSYSISEKLQNIEALSSSIISNPTVQEQLSALKECDNAIVQNNANRSLNTVLLNHFSTLSSNLSLIHI